MLVFHDHLTKFVILRLLVIKKQKNLHLASRFFTAPFVFCNWITTESPVRQVMQALHCMLPRVRIVYSKLRDREQRSIEREN
jgi:hypothetical protein